MHGLFELCGDDRFLPAIIIMFFVCLFANMVWELMQLRAESNTSFYLRFHDPVYDYIAILYKEIRTMRLDGKTEEEIQSILKNKFETHSFSFLMNPSMTTGTTNAIEIVKEIINDRYLLFKYVAAPSFNKKQYRALMEERIKKDDEKDARLALKDILSDKSKKSIDAAMVWLPLLMTPPFTKVEDDPAKGISKTKNYFFVFSNLTRAHSFLAGASHDKFLKCLNALKELNPSMAYPKSKSNSGKYSNNTPDEDIRKTQMLDKINEVAASIKSSTD